MHEHSITYKDSTIHYYVFGNGKKLLFCFHGYGRSGYSFYFLERLLGKDYTLLAPDLPFHGSTLWNDDLTLKPETFIEIIQQIIVSVQKSSNATIQQFGNSPIQPVNHSTFSLLGFSMGGRVALHLLQIIPEQIEKVVLIAPDGLHKNFWYSLITQTGVGNRLFSYTMKNPQWLFKLLNRAERVGLINKSLYGFAQYYIDNAPARMLLYKRWITMRKFKPGFSVVKAVLQKHHIPLRLMFGKYDRIILSEHSSFFKYETKADVKVHMVQAGHHLLTESFAGDIVMLLNK